MKRLGKNKRPPPTRANFWRRGVTAIEFALIAPFMFLFMMGTIEMSLILLAQHLLENATFNASRTAKTGYVESGMTQMETVQATLNARLSGLAPLLDVSKIELTSTAYGDLSAIGQPDQGETETLGAPEQVVVYTVTYPWKMFTPMVGNLIGDGSGNFNISSRIVVRNEPYDD